MTPRTAIAIGVWGWVVIAVCLYIVHQIEPSPTAPAPGSPPAWVESGAVIAAQPARSSSAPGWAAPTDNSKGK